MHPGLSKKNCEKNMPQARFFMKKIAQEARLIKQNAPQARIFDQVLMGTLSYWCEVRIAFIIARKKIM